MSIDFIHETLLSLLEEHGFNTAGDSETSNEIQSYEIDVE